MPTPRPRAAVPLLLALTVTAALGACSSGSSPDSGTTAPASATAAPYDAGAAAHNAADVTFSQQLGTLDRAALQLADVAQSRATDPQVRSLATAVPADVQTELDSVTAYLDAWQAPPAPTPTPVPTTLASAGGSAFDRLFVDALAADDRRVVDLARQEQGNGQYQPARQLAQLVANDRALQIGRLQRARPAS